MNRIVLSLALALTVAPLASSARADSMRDINKAFSTISKAASGVQKKFVSNVAHELRSLNAKHALTIEQPNLPEDGSYFATLSHGNTVVVDRRTVSMDAGAGYIASFRVDRHGNAIRNDTLMSSDPFKPIKTFASSYSDGAGRPLSKLVGWVRWTMARAPLLP